MSDYSKITEIELYNFMVFKHAKVSFDETGILNFKGYNDAGKSTILRATAIVLMDMFKSKQAKCIQFGEDYFRIVISFEDGVSILKDKYSNGQSLYEMYKNEDLIFTTKIGNKLGKVDGVPKVIEDYLGLCVTDSVYFNYQSCVDKLPLVDTGGSENYSMLHEVLKIEEISRANRLINTDKNELGTEIGELEYTLQVNGILLEKCINVTEELVSELSLLEEDSSINSNRHSDALDLVHDFSKGLEFVSLPEIKKVNGDRLKKCLELADIGNKVITAIDLPQVDSVKYERVKGVQNLANLLSKVNNVVDIPTIETVGVDRLKSIMKISLLVGEVNNAKDLEIPQIEKVGLGSKDRVKKLSIVSNALAKLDTCLKELGGVNIEIESLQATLNDVVKEATKQGLSFVKCSNCGTFNEVGGVSNE